MTANPKIAAKLRPAASAYLEFSRSMSDVRALFFDVALAVRTRIHKGVRLRWLPRTSAGERRLSRLTRVLGRIQRDEIMVEEGPGGSWVKRFVSGPNEGTRFVAQFTPVGPSSTTVTLDAYPGPRGFAQGLGPLSPLGLEKALQRILSEYQRALEKYVPGRARGRVVDALIALGPAVASVHELEPSRHVLVVTTLLEAAWAVAVVDGHPDEAECDAMQAVAGTFWRGASEAPNERRMMQAAVQAIAKEGVAARCTSLGARLKSARVGELGVAVAALVADVSRGLDVPELTALNHLATAAGLDHGRLTSIVRRTEELLLGGDRISRMSMLV